MSTRIIAFDLGSTTGFAEGTSEFCGHITSVKTYSWELALKKTITESQKSGTARFMDPRVAAFAYMVEKQRNCVNPSLIVYEDVQFGRSVAQCQLWGSFRGVLQSFAIRASAPIISIPTGTLKKWTTGNGAAQKEDMKKAALKRWAPFIKALATHDEIDALALLMWGFEYYRHKQLSLGE